MLKDRLYRSKNALELALRSCPELEQSGMELHDGHVLKPREILEWLEGARLTCWHYGPPEVQAKRLKEIVSQQPRG